ncbi:MAG TPA: MarR family transcriptional regulator [Steroidobacteraceae bacterium]|nr:MarR family transcriptional regulator [Steroidobacteraceae bacterium]
MNRLRNFGFLLKGVSRLSGKNFERHARDLGLSLSQCKVLVYLARNEGISQSRLAEMSESDPMTLVRMLDAMEADHWIERRPDPSDRRAHRLYLQDGAKPVLARIWKVADAARDEALAGLSAAERDQLMNLLERIQSNLSALDAGDKAAPGPQRRKA